jgi:hypothetical protein
MGREAATARKVDPNESIFNNLLSAFTILKFFRFLENEFEGCPETLATPSFISPLCGLLQLHRVNQYLEPVQMSCSSSRHGQQDRSRYTSLSNIPEKPTTSPQALHRRGDDSARAALLNSVSQECNCDYLQSRLASAQAPLSRIWWSDRSKQL